jgi:hypothetical protein
MACEHFAFDDSRLCLAKKRLVGKFTKTPRGATAAMENVVE